MRQLLQNETESSYQKFSTKCDIGLVHSRQVLQAASGITKCYRLLLH